MTKNNNDKALGLIILAGLVIFVLIAILQFLVIIFLILTVFAILATVIFLVLGFMDEYNRQDYWLYAGIAFFCIFVFFFLGQATYQTSAALQNNEITKGLMAFTSAFFFIQEQKQEAINQLNNVQISVLNNLTTEINNIK